MAGDELSGQLLGVHGGPGLLDGRADRVPAVSERAIESDGELTRRGVCDRAVHADDTVHDLGQRICHVGAVAGIEHDQARHRRDARDHRRERTVADVLRAIIRLQHDAGATRRLDIALRARGGHGPAVAGAVAAEVQDGRRYLVECAHQLIDPDYPLRVKLEAVAVSRQAELVLERLALPIECELVSAARVRGDVQDRMLHRELPCRPRRAAGHEYRCATCILATLR